jgi:two-component system copper resistance phosphate regulon response regulator CusR
MHILVVEDEVRMAQIIARGLKAEGYAITTAHSAKAGMELMRAGVYDLMILDLMLPDFSGIELLRSLREQRRGVPVLAVTARSELEAKAETFDAGADDYLTKPFAFAELVMRVKALLRRSPVPLNDIVRIGDLEMNRITHRVQRAGRRIELSPKEYSLLEYLILNPYRVLSRSMIMDHVWDQSFEGLTNIVDVYVRQVRRKIDDGFEPKLIRTVRGIGYAIDPMGEL